MEAVIITDLPMGAKGFYEEAFGYGFLREDCIDSRRTALFMLRLMLREYRDGGLACCNSSQAVDDHAEEPGGNPGERRTGQAGGRALWYQRADGLKVAQARQLSGLHPHAEPVAGHEARPGLKCQGFVLSMRFRKTHWAGARFSETA